MNNQTDTFELIAQDAVDLLTAIVRDLRNSDDPADRLIAELIAEAATEFCLRALALGAE